MKRGLVVLDPAEVGDEEWSARVRDVQRQLAEGGVSVALVYGDVFRSDDIGYLTNLCIYWNEGVLAVPVEGPPVFLTKLSPRVHTWMRATSKVTDLRSGKSFGPLVRELLQSGQPGVLGLVDRHLWPDDLVAEVTAAADGWEVRGQGDVVRRQRLVPSPAELSLLRDGAEALRRTFDAAARPGLSETERVATVERGLRGEGYSDVMATTATTSDGVTTLEVTGQYRHGWLHLAKPLDAGGTAWGAQLDGALRAAVAAIADGATSDDLAAAAEPELAALPDGTRWHLRCVNQVDMATGGEYVGALPDDGLPRGAVIVVGIELLFVDGHRAAAAETVLVGADGAEPLVVKETAR